ncbi:MAG: hypothetical protein KC619_35285, partial [Myxococcales bacterium]|nr:hypothetical protein [Myxococcales bacterium]
IIGILAAIAIPAFIGYLTRSKTSEAGANLKNMFTAAAGYYSNENWGSRGVVLAAGSTLAASACAVDTVVTPTAPSAAKHTIDWNTAAMASFTSIGFSLRDPVYFQYRLETSGGGRCGITALTPIYSFQAQGDLDGDGVTSLYEIQAGSSPLNELMRSPGIYRVNELE